ncbi:bacteriocin-like protein [Chryseobacterium gossypii]|uniref:bacteriocin-like protein n=1 Tax=Chryseobacterium gossypii TaxID=3231602 RepID=UPI003525685F
MKNLKKISRGGLKSIIGGNVTCPIPGSSVPAICPGTVCPPDPCTSTTCLIPASCAGNGPF